MSRVAMFEQQLADAEKAGNTASANRLKFIISKEKRNAANRDEKQESRKRKAEYEGSGPYKAMRFTDNGVLPASMGTIRDMLLEERAREQQEIKAKAEAAKKREEERIKAERARKTAESQRKRREYKARQEAEAKREREEKARKYWERQKREEEEERERRERNSRPKPKPQPRAQPPAPRATPRPAARPATVQEIQAWRTFANACFADYSKVLTFPAPPGGCCAATGCQAAASAGRSLKACDCNIRRAFRNSNGINYKIERLKWHPDRWAKCPEAKRDELRKVAAEVFVVVNAMI